jgi:hypothetical protein
MRPAGPFQFPLSPASAGKGGAFRILRSARMFRASHFDLRYGENWRMFAFQ